MPGNPLRNLPSVGALLENASFKGLVDLLSQQTVASRVRAVLDEVRNELQTSATEASLPSVGDLAERIARRIWEEERPRLRPVINASGALLLTGAGGLPLAESVIEEMVAVARDYASEVPEAAGEGRPAHEASLEESLRELTRAEGAIVVNNLTAATLLTLTSIAATREVLVSRAHLLELSGGSRLHELVAQSGARLREVGSANKTRLQDYREALSDQTAAILTVHLSHATPASADANLPELARLGHERQVPLVQVLDSSTLVDLAPYGLVGVPRVAECIRAGVDLVCLSGEKYLGGPRCGMVVGRRTLVDSLQRHPLAAVLALDKVNLAALSATLNLYRQPKTALRDIPLLRLLDTPLDNLKLRAHRLAEQIAAGSAIASAKAIEDRSPISEDDPPHRHLPTWCVAIEPKQLAADRFAAELRAGRPSVIGRVKDDRLLVDLRTVFPRQDQELVKAVAALHSPPPATRETN